MLNVAVLIYDQVEVIDLTGPIDVFTKANVINNNKYNVYTVGINNSTINTENNTLQITPKYIIYDCPPPDLIIIPGAHPDKIMELCNDIEFNNIVIKWIKDIGKDKTIMSVCTGAILLGKTGLLDNKKSTTHFMALDILENMYPKTKVIKDVKYIEDENIITTAGVTSGIDGAIYLIKKYNGENIAKEIAKIMEYEINF